MNFLQYIKEQGYIRYKGAVSASVYEYFRCPDSNKALWYYRKGSYQCVGCKEQCETDSCSGFQMFLDLS